MYIIDTDAVYLLHVKYSMLLINVDVIVACNKMKTLHHHNFHQEYKTLNLYARKNFNLPNHYSLQHL